MISSVTFSPAPIPVSFGREATDEILPGQALSEKQMMQQLQAASSYQNTKVDHYFIQDHTGPTIWECVWHPFKSVAAFESIDQETEADQAIRNKTLSDNGVVTSLYLSTGDSKITKETTINNSPVGAEIDIQNTNQPNQFLVYEKIKKRTV